MFFFIFFSISGVLDGGLLGLVDFLIIRVVGFKILDCRGDLEILFFNCEWDFIIILFSGCFCDGVFVLIFFGVVEVDILFKFRFLYVLIFWI